MNPGSLRLWCGAVVAALLLGNAAVKAHEEAHHGHATAEQVGHDPHAQPRAMLANAPQPQSASTAVRLHERTLMTQDGESIRFPHEVIGDRIVVMDFVYTTCTTVCPVLSAIMERVQSNLGEHLGAEVLLVSLSVDPGRDTPERLKAYAARHHSRPGWVWLTGDKTSVDKVLTGLGAYTPDFEDHPSMVLVGDGRSGQWSRFFGFPSPNQILATVEGLLAARKPTHAGVASHQHQ